MKLAQLNAFVVEKINSGIVVIDSNFQVLFINNFVEVHAHVNSDDIVNRSLFEAFPDLPQNWLKRKVQGVISLNTPAFSAWEQRQFLFKMAHTRPITTASEYMAQNCTLLPISNEQGQVEQICIIIEDATDVCYYQEQLNEAVMRLEKSNQTDSLTQVANRRYWEERCIVEFDAARRHEHDFSLMLFDLDKFKQINDTYGHRAGDKVLVEVAKKIKTLLRGTDLIGRYGGEEFGIICPNTDAQGSSELAERILKEIQMLKITFEKHIIFTSISIGVVQIQPEYQSYEDMVSRADLALYQSKREGRNQVTLYKA